MSHLGWLCAAALAAWSLSIGTAASQENGPSPGPFNPDCPAAFEALPLKDGFAVDVTGALVPENQMRAFYHQHQAVYEAYETACMTSWAQLHQNTKDFLGPNVGALFEVRVPGRSTGYVPYCSAFRIATDLIVTAQHCVGANVVFRLIAAPLEDIEVLDEVASGAEAGAIAGDLDDWAIYRIQPPPTPFTWSQGTFQPPLLPHNSVVVVAIDEFAFFEQLQADSSRWVDAIRFSRTNSGQLWGPDEVDTPVTTRSQVARCLFDRIQTAARMSGSPVIAVRRPQFEGDTPHFYVVGMHLRNGADRSAGGSSASCGYQPDFNVGARLSSSVLARAGRH